MVSEDGKMTADALDAAVGRDDEGGAEGAHVFAAGKFLLAPHAEFLYEGVVGVAD